MKRIVVAHIHVFKNAGTTLDWIFEKNFHEGFLDHREPKLFINGGEGYLADLIETNKSLKVVSSHHFGSLNPTKVTSNSLEVVSAIIIRHPIERIMSVYKYERKQKIETLGAIHAKKYDFKEYVQWRMRADVPATIRNQMTNFLSGIKNKRNSNIFFLAVKNLLNSPLVGVVDRFDESMLCFSEYLSGYYPEIDMSYIPQNINQEPKQSIADKISDIRNLLGDNLYDEVLEKNNFDLELYRAANLILDSRLSKIQDRDSKYEELIRKNTQKYSENLRSDKPLVS